VATTPPTPNESQRRAPPARLAFSFGPERPYLNGVVPGGRVSGPNLDRVLAISTPDDVYACDELLNVEE
jgi:hypothetical protein